MPTTSAELLKSRHRLIRDGQPEALRLRIHRALSRLTRAEREQGDLDDLLGVPRPWCARTPCGRMSV